jgi:hypothetical protein
VLERNELYGYSVEHQITDPTRVRMTTPIKAVSAIHVQSPSDDQFAPLRKLIEELRELAAAEEPKALPGTGGDDQQPAGIWRPSDTAGW